ncbi:putative F-box only protein 9 [Musa acuminata AAA Group]|uniref:putative F-box only protein 9 n=1 Tax=Musa acuminata AAA Group TaxID=214697 RepID=UPI0031D06561
MEKKMKKKRMAARTTSLKIGKRQLCHGKCSRYSLPDDLLVQILSRLPVKSTLRFRCVSKEWLALLSDRGPYSIRYLCPTMCGFFYRRSHLAGSWQYAAIHPFKDHRFDLHKLISHLPDHRNLNLLDSCHGLLLLGCREDRSYKSMIVCNPFRNDEINWVTIHMNTAVKQLPLQRKFISAKLVSHRASRSFKCLLFFEDYRLNELDAESNFWCTVLYSNRGQSHHIYQIPRHVPPPFDLYDIAFDNNYLKGCIIQEDKKDHLISSALNERRNGRVRSLVGVSRGLAHFAFCDEHELHIWILEREDGKRVWKPKHNCSCQPLIKQHKESHRHHKHEGNERVYSILPLGFHPDLDIIFLQIEWRIYSLHLGSGSMDEVAGERGANPESEMFLFHPFTMDPSTSLGERREYHMGLIPVMDP